MVKKPFGKQRHFKFERNFKYQHKTLVAINLNIYGVLKHTLLVLSLIKITKVTLKNIVIKFKQS